MNTTPERIDLMIQDRIQAMVDQAMTMQTIDPELSDYILYEAMEFAKMIDAMDENDAIFWCEKL